MVSVAICTYNGERHLAEQLDSIFAQTIPVDEIIVNDDGSSDATVAILREYEKRHPGKFFIRQNLENFGFEKNFREAILRCRGDYIFICDQDDRWHQNKVEKMLQQLPDTKQPALVFSDAEIISQTGERVGTSLYKIVSHTKKISKFGAENFFEWLMHGWCYPGMTMLIEKSYLKPLREINDKLPKDTKISHDALLLLIASSGYGDITAYDEVLMEYRSHDQQAIGIKETMTPAKLAANFIQKSGKWNKFVETKLNIFNAYFIVANILFPDTPAGKVVAANLKCWQMRMSRSSSFWARLLNLPASYKLCKKTAFRPIGQTFFDLLYSNSHKSPRDL